MADQIFQTPGGCRIDNGRCFQLLEWREDEQGVFARFTDGSEYLYTGLAREYAEAWIAQIDPGCRFNRQIWPGQFSKLRGPD